MYDFTKILKNFTQEQNGSNMYIFERASPYCLLYNFLWDNSSTYLYYIITVVTLTIPLNPKM